MVPETNKTEDTNKLTLLAFKIITSFTTHCWQRSSSFWKLSANASLETDCRTAVTRSWIGATYITKQLYYFGLIIHNFISKQH
jgi:hypothetical protein